jgi:hypothetical protein
LRLECLNPSILKPASRPVIPQRLNCSSVLAPPSASRAARSRGSGFVLCDGFRTTAPLWARRLAPGPSSESRQGRNPREIGHDQRCRAMGIWLQRTERVQPGAVAGGNVDCFEFGLERRLKAHLRLAVRQGGWFGGVWCACDALTLLPAMNRLARARLSGEHSASS